MILKRDTSLDEIIDDISNMKTSYTYETEEFTVYSERKRARCCSGVYWRYKVYSKNLFVATVNIFGKACCPNHKSTEDSRVKSDIKDVIYEAKQKHLKLLFEYRQKIRREEMY